MDQQLYYMLTTDACHQTKSVNINNKRKDKITQNKNTGI